MNHQENESVYDFWGASPTSEIISTTSIFVYAESRDSELEENSIRVLGKARELADALGTGIGAICLDVDNEDFARKLISAGADKVFLSKDDRFKTYETELFCSQLFSLVQEKHPEMLMAALSHFTCDFFPRLAQRIATGLVSGCTGLEIDTADRSLLATRPIYGGKMFEVRTWQHPGLQMVLLQPGIFPQPITDEFRSGDIEKI